MFSGLSGRSKRPSAVFSRLSSSSNRPSVVLTRLSGSSKEASAAFSHLSGSSKGPLRCFQVLSDCRKTAGEMAFKKTPSAKTQLGCNRHPNTLSRSHPSRSNTAAVAARCLRSTASASCTSRLEKVSINWVTASTRAVALACNTSSGAFRSISKAGMVQSIAVSG